MPQQRMYYDYVDDQLVPFWYVLTFKYGEVNWDNHVFYFTPIQPFNYVEREEFDESLISVTIFFSDFVFNPSYPEKFGINISSVKKRIERYSLDPDIVHQFIITLPDINDLLPMLPTERKLSLLVS
jgi:hypothetical protein